MLSARFRASRLRADSLARASVHLRETLRDRVRLNFRFLGIVFQLLVASFLPAPLISALRVPRKPAN